MAHKLNRRATRTARSAIAGIAVLALWVAAQESGVATQTGAKRGEPFELKPNETRDVTEELRVRFDGVTEDSRCPVEVSCVWEGDAAVQLTLEKPPAAADTLVVHTSGRYGRETEYAGLVIRLVELKPEPHDGAQIPPEDYRVTLVVESKPKER